MVRTKPQQEYIPYFFHIPNLVLIGHPDESKIGSIVFAHDKHNETGSYHTCFLPVFSIYM